MSDSDDESLTSEAIKLLKVDYNKIKEKYEGQTKKLEKIAISMFGKGGYPSSSGEEEEEEDVKESQCADCKEKDEAIELLNLKVASQKIVIKSLKR